MPVSTFSAADSNIQHHRGSLVARRDDTRDSIIEDERRRSMSAMGGLNGPGLFERPDWPLPRDRRKSTKQSDAMETGYGPTMDDAVLPQPAEMRGYTEADGHVGEADVSDVEEEDERPARRGRDSALHVHSNGTLARALHTETSASISPPEEDRKLEVSPALDQQNLIRVVSRDPDDEPPIRLDQEQGAVETEETRENGEHEAYTTIESHVVPNQYGFAASSPIKEEDEDGEEPSTNGHSENIKAYHTTPTISSHLPRSSVSKSPLAPGLHRRSSTRSSLNLYASPPRKERVRYSWQSIQDVEPNRPRIHIIKLVSNTVTSSAGFPQGEAFGFSISPGGRRIAAYNSARLYVLQTAALPVGISQDYALRRRPLAVELTDEPNTMAILADDHTVNIYELGVRRMHLRRTIKLDFPTNCIALAPTGGLLAAAYEGGLEIFSLHPSALPTDRRAVRSSRMDRMAFSEDGSTLLGTTTRINVSSTVVVSVPVFPAAPNGVPTHEELKEAWCAELLHPENIRNSSHATFLRENRKTCNERLFAWNGLADTFGILHVGDMQYGGVDFPIVIAPPLSTCGGLGAAIHSCPSIDEHGDTVAMIVNDRTVRLYIMPPKSEDEATPVEAHSIDHELDEGYGCPFSEVRWVHNAASQPAAPGAPKHVLGRLIVTSPGGVLESGTAEESVEDIEGGRIILFDFDPQFASQPGQTYNLNLGKSPPQMLEEESVNVAEQIALVRRRTVNQSKKANLSSRPVVLGRAATTFGNGRGSRSNSPALMNNTTLGPRASMLSIGSMHSEAARSLPDLMETHEQADAFEEPYAQSAPRSQVSLQRAATNAQRHRFQALEERDQEGVSVDSIGNFLALPEYTEEPNAPLPSRFRAMAGLDQPTMWNGKKVSAATHSNGNAVSPVSSGPSTAPPNVGEHFSAEQAFSAANAAAATAAHSHARTGTPPPDTATISSLGTAGGTFPRSGAGSRLSGARPNSLIGETGSYDSLAPLPRSIQRAYGNAPLGPAPRLIGDWQNVSPITDRGTSRGYMSSVEANILREDEQRDLVSPMQPSSPGPAGTGGIYIQNGHAYPRAPPPFFPSPASISHLPPHMQARQQAASASLFPPNLPHDHVPIRQPPVKPSAVAHPVTSWRPPGASSIPRVTASASTSHLPSHTSPAYGSDTGLGRRESRRSRAPGAGGGHLRQTSASGRSAFASTEQAKKLGFFSRRRRKNHSNAVAHDPYARHHADMEGGSLLETRSVMTWVTGRDGRCHVM